VGLAGLVRRKDLLRGSLRFGPILSRVRVVSCDHGGAMPSQAGLSIETSNLKELRSRIRLNLLMKAL
jgi:hypothetical protein